MPLCDTLLRLAAVGFYSPVWSTTLLDELVRSLEDRGFPSDAAHRRRAAMLRVFPEALNDDGRTFTASVPSAVDDKDRHVVATAIASRAETIVTANLKDFAVEEVRGIRIQVVTPDEFLLAQWELNRAGFIELLGEQADALQHPRLSLADLLVLNRECKRPL